MWIKYRFYQIKSILKKKYVLSRVAKVGSKEYYSVPHKYANSKIVPADEASEFIYNGIMSGEPFFAGRFGGNEMNALSIFDNKIKANYEVISKDMCNGAGFFPNDYDELYKFSQLMKSSISQLDYLAVWNLPMDEYYIKKYTTKKITMSRLRYFEPWFAKLPWTKALEGKKVLVIHPFADTIKSQYENNRDKLFDNKDLLPEFELITQRAVQTIAGNKDERFDTWFDALDYMFDEAMKTDFDIALIGCGAYGFPLGAKLKEAGKQAIHFGGVLQILFGIRGARWDNDECDGDSVANLYNDYWVRPSKSETPKSHSNVENGCYW